MKVEYFQVTVLDGPLKDQGFKVSRGVTYITGANGSGKSQFFEAIKAGQIKIEKEPHRGGARPAPPSWEAQEWFSENNDPDESKLNYRYDEIRNLMEEMNQVLPEENVISTIDPEEKKDADGGVFVETRQKTEIKHHGLPFNKEAISKGTNALLEAFKWHGKGITYPRPKPAKSKSRHGRNVVVSSVVNTGGGRKPLASIVFYLWDEPEVHLHPREQRKLSCLLYTSDAADE